VRVFPLPGASTGTGVSSPCSLLASSTYRRNASLNGAIVRQLAPTQPASVERDSSTSLRA
jgi:hypothetical protein